MSRGDSGTNADVPTPYAGNGALSIDDDRAIIRDNRTLGYSTVSLLYAVAEVSSDGVKMHDHELPAPGRWG